MQGEINFLLYEQVWLNNDLSANYRAALALYGLPLKSELDCNVENDPFIHVCAQVFCVFCLQTTEYHMLSEEM